MATANAGRKAKPAGLKLLEGGKNAAGEPVDSGGRPIQPGPNFRRIPPEKPDDLSPDADWLWDKVIEELQRVDLLKPLDGASLRVACETYARWCEAVRFRQERGILSTNSQGIVRAPWLAIEEQASKDFRAWCAEYGLTPAAESKVGGASVDGDGDVNPFD